MHLRDYLHDMPLKALKAIALRLDVRVEYEARIKLVNAVDRAFWDGTLVTRLLKDLSGEHHRLLSMIASSYDKGIGSKSLIKKFEKITGSSRQDTKRLIEDLISISFVGAVQRNEPVYFCPRGVAEHVRAFLHKHTAFYSDDSHLVPAATPPHLLEDITSLLALIYQKPVSLTLMGRIRKAVLDRAFNGSPTCTGPYPLAEDFRNGFVCEYLKQRGLVLFEHRKAVTTPLLQGWLKLSMTERFNDILSFGLRHILHDDYTITAVTGLLGETPAGTGLEIIKLAHFLHADTMSPGGFARIESRLKHFFDVLTRLGLSIIVEGRYVLTKTGATLLQGKQHPLDDNISTSFTTQPNFEIILGPEIDMRTRFTLELLSDRKNRDLVLTYEVTREGIARARERGLTTSGIIAFFEKHTKNALPQNVRFSIESWAKAYGCIYFEDAVLMRFRDAGICDSVYHLPEVSPYIIEQISDTVLVVSVKHIQHITAQVKKAGYHPECYGETDGKSAEIPEEYIPGTPEMLLSENAIPMVQNTFIFPEKLLSNGDEK